MSLLPADHPDFCTFLGWLSLLCASNFMHINLYHCPTALFVIYCLASDSFTTPESGL